MHDEAKKLLTPDQMAFRLGVKKRTVYELTWKKKIPMVPVGRLMRFEEEEVLRALKGEVGP